MTIEYVKYLAHTKCLRNGSYNYVTFSLLPPGFRRELPLSPHHTVPFHTHLWKVGRLENDFGDVTEHAQVQHSAPPLRSLQELMSVCSYQL